MSKLSGFGLSLDKDHCDDIDPDRPTREPLALDHGLSERPEFRFLGAGDVCFWIDLSRVVEFGEPSFDFDEHEGVGLGFQTDQVDLTHRHADIAIEHAIP